MRLKWQIALGSYSSVAKSCIHSAIFLEFSVYKSFTSSVKFIPEYIILLDAITNEIAF